MVTYRHGQSSSGRGDEDDDHRSRYKNLEQNVAHAALRSYGARWLHEVDHEAPTGLHSPHQNRGLSVDKDKIAKALDMGVMWTAKWLADLADVHEGTDTDHLVKSARKALRTIQEAKTSL